MKYLPGSRNELDLLLYGSRRSFCGRRFGCPLWSLSSMGSRRAFLPSGRGQSVGNGFDRIPGARIWVVDFVVARGS